MNSNDTSLTLPWNYFSFNPLKFWISNTWHPLFNLTLVQSQSIYKPWCTYISQPIHFIQTVIAHATVSCEQLWSKWMANEKIVSLSLKKVSSLLNCVITFNYLTVISNIRCLWKNVTTRLTILFVKFSLASLLANMSDTASVESRKREAHSAFLDLTW